MNHNTKLAPSTREVVEMAIQLSKVSGVSWEKLIRVTIEQRDGHYMAYTDDVPGLNICGKDRASVLADIPSAAQFLIDANRPVTTDQQYIVERLREFGMAWTEEAANAIVGLRAENDALRKQASEAGFDLNCAMPLVRQALRTVDEWNNDPLKSFVHPFTKYANTARAAMARYDAPPDDAALANRPAEPATETKT